jgi:hypothetical protein
MIAPTIATALVSVYSADRHRCIGHILRRRELFEAYDADDKSIGMFATQDEAAQALLAPKGGA